MVFEQYINPRCPFFVKKKRQIKCAVRNLRIECTQQFERIFLLLGADDSIGALYVVY